MSDLHTTLAGFLDGLCTAVDRLSLDEGNEFAKGYRTALDDISSYVDEVQAGLIEKRVEES